MAPPINDKKKLQIIYLHGSGKSYDKISSETGVHKSSVRYIINKFKADQTISRKPGSGRPFVFDDAIKHQIQNHFKENPHHTFEEGIRALQINCSKMFAFRACKEVGISTYVAKVKPFLNDENKESRKQFYQNTLGWTVDQWREIVFSDESTFKTNPNRVLVKHMKKQEFDPKFIVEKNRRIFSINVWGCMNGKDLTLQVYNAGKRFNSEKYLALMNEKVIPMLKEKMDENWTFQQDNARIHTTNNVLAMFHEEHIMLLQWPPYSPDLSPIENLWAILKKRVQKRIRTETIRTEDEYFNLIEQEAMNIPPDVIKNLYESMPKRMTELVSKNFGSIKY